MNQLVKSQSEKLMLAPEKQAALETLDQESQRIIQAALSGPMKEADYQLTVGSLIELISSVYVNAGQTIKAESSMSFAGELYSVVTAKFPTCTLQEVRIAINNGLYGEYGEYYGLNPKSFVHFIRSYMTSQERQKAREEFNARAKMLSMPERKPREFEYWQAEFWTEEIVAKWMEETNKFYQYYLADNMIFQATPEACYWLLQHAGRIRMTPGYVNILLKSAQERLRARIYQNKEKRSLEYIQQTVEWIATGQNDEVNYQLNSIAMHIALGNFFRKQRQKGITEIFQS